jgi:hypothetical protein
VLPDHQPLGAEVARRLDRFVQRGGTMVATGRVGFRDGEYESRNALALECLGIERVRTVRADMRGSYLEIDERDGFGRLERTDLVYLDGPYVEADYRTETRRRMRLVPPSPFGPPERCYYETVTKKPGFTVHTHGKGRAVYVPWLCGALLPNDGEPSAVISLASGRECPWSWSGGQLTIRVPELRLFEALKIARRADPRSGG